MRSPRSFEVAGNGTIYYDTPPAIRFLSAGGYTRQPYSFNEGWRSRFFLDYTSSGQVQLMTQGAGLPNANGQWASTNIFGPHFWPFGGPIPATRFSFEMVCVRAAGCDRSNFNAADSNTMLLTLNDPSPPVVSVGEGPLAGGGWVKGSQPISWATTEVGSGLRYERLRVDGAERWAADYRVPCDLGSTEAGGEFARSFVPCPRGGPFPHSATIDTASLADGSHTATVCAQDFGQASGLNGSGGESCEARAIHTDNSPPAAPLSPAIGSTDPARYLANFSASWGLESDPGSPITKVHYWITDAAGTVVVPERVLAGSNPTEIPDISGPAQAGAYRLRVWLEDEVGFVGPAAITPVPHDTTPPTAPQGLSVAAPQTSRAADGFDVRWRNLNDAGSPINAAHYQVLNGAGKVVVSTRDLGGDDLQAIENLDTPTERGAFLLRLWLSDAEGNVGAPVTAPLTYDCARSAAEGGTSLSAGFGTRSETSALVHEGEGDIISGRLQGPSGPVANAPLCIFDNVVTDQERQFLGVAMTDGTGDYQFSIGAGPSRDVAAEYRSGNREVTANATLRTTVTPTFRLRRKVIHNKGFAVFTGAIPGPHNGQVVVVLQVKDGKSWRVFRRYQTQDGGQFLMRYRFTQTTTPTKYTMRAQVRAQSGYPYDPGNSRALPLRVMP